MWTWSSKEPSGCCSTRTASSKSRAVSPSMVTMGRPRKSALRAASAGSRWATATGLLEDTRRKDARELVLADHHLHIDAEIVGVAEDLNDAAHGRARGGGPGGDFDVDDEAFQVVVAECMGAGFFAEDAVRRGLFRRGRDFIAGADEDGLGHALVKGDDGVVRLAIAARVMKGADHGGVAAGQDAGNAAEAPVRRGERGRRKLDQDLVALHGAVDLAWGDEDIVFQPARRSRVFAGLAGVGADKTVAVAMEVEAAGDEIVAGVSAA